MLSTTFSVFSESDPTMPSDWNPTMQTTIVPKDIILTGIFTRGDQRTAIMNTKSVNVGDYIQGYEITKMTDNLVYLKNNQGIFVLPLTPRVRNAHVTIPEKAK
ncbi:MAG: hypothetical protein NTZ67_04880 [Gammaproteobacteria bacterium]|nr:hypothetical protein [Gammaproteobacteria bacterium]